MKTSIGSAKELVLYFINDEKLQEMFKGWEVEILM